LATSDTTPTTVVPNIHCMTFMSDLKSDRSKSTLD
jgi:hypothetical protein